MVALLFLYGIWLRWLSGLVAVTTEDSFLFLSPALFGKFSEAGPRTFPYPLFLKICIEYLGGFPAAILGQKVAGLATAGLIFGAWSRLKCVLPYRLAGIVLHDLLGLFMLSHLLLEHATMRYYEQAIMLESTSSLCLAAVIFAACHFLVLVRLRSTERPIALWGAILIGASLLTYAWNPRFGPAVVFAFPIAFAGLNAARMRAARIFLVYFVPVALSGLLFFLPQFLISRSNGWNRAFIPKHLFYVHARLVLPELVHDRDDPGFKRYRHEILEQLSSLIEQELARAERDGPGGNFTLGFSPNLLLWGKADGILHNFFADDPDGYREFCLYYFMQAVRNQPGAYAQKVAVEWNFLLQPGFPIMDSSLSPYALKDMINGGNCLPGAREMVPRATDAVRPAFQAFVVQLENHASYDDLVLSSPDFLRFEGSWVNDYFSYSLLSALAACGLCLWRKFREPGHVNLCLVFAGSALLLLGLIAPITIVMTVCGGRHIQGLRVAFVFCAASSTLLTVMLAASLVGARRLLFLPAD